MAYLGNAPARSFISFERQVFTIVNSQTVYTLSHSVTNENDIRLVVNNIVQEPGSGKAYTASGTTLTLSAALVNGTDEMYCVFLGRAVGTVNAPAGSVDTAQLASDSVTAAKLNDDIISGQNALGAEPADTDEFLVSDAGTIKRVDYSYIKGGLDGWSSSSGNLLPADASKGIYLGVNSATAANLLNDYEEGTFTPALLNASSATFNQQVGKYIKIGNLVQAHINLSISNLNGGSGTTTITGLPFTAGNTPSNSMYSGTVLGDDNWSTNLSGTNLISYIQGGYQPDYVIVRRDSGSNLATVNLTDIGTSRLQLSICYSTV